MEPLLTNTAVVHVSISRVAERLGDVAVNT